jgi:hypothetical protein
MYIQIANKMGFQQKKEEYLLEIIFTPQMKCGAHSKN